MSETGWIPVIRIVCACVTCVFVGVIIGRELETPHHVADASKIVAPAPITRAEFDALRLRVDRIEAESAVAAPTGRVR